MFNENEDWNDEQDAQILCKTVLNTEKTDRNTNLKSKAVGKKSLLRTLQTLGSGPEWTSNNYEQKDSDSETEAAPSPSKKKKNRKKRKHLKKSEEQQEDGQMVMEEKPSSQKKKKGNKPGTPKANSISADETMDKTNTESPQANVNKPQNSEKLSRQQWKNKMKNKRKCKNKFLQNKPEEDVNKANEQEPKGEIKSDSLSNNNNCENISDTRSLAKRKDRKLLKRNNPDDDTDGFTTAKKKKQQKKERSGKADEDSFKGSAAVSNQKAAELQVEVRNDQLQFATRRQKLELSKEQSLKRQKLQKILLRHEAEQHETPVDQKEPLAPPEEEVKQSRSDSFRARMEQRLEASRFRYINELLYSTSSGEAKRMFQQDPQAFKIYHKGYTAQVQRWPANPVDQIISYIQKKPSSLVIADFGCGDCKIARSVKNKVHSYDLAATCQLVTVCDMANVPLGDGSVDIAVFCLSLMGTNLADFLAEANRVLKMGGILKIAEVSSRFDNVRNFITALARLGFKMTSKDTENSHFYSFEFVKTGNAPKNTVKFGLQLKPCLYKKR